MKHSIEELWLKFSGKLKVYILSKVRDEAVADDILQEVFIKIHSKIDTLNDHSKVQPWVYQIARNSTIDYFRKNRKNNLESSNLTDYEEESGEDLVSEALDDMIKAMDGLSPEYCEALCLTELKGMKQKDYAEKAGITLTAAKTRVRRARIMLKDMLMNCCHYEFDKYGTVIDIHPIRCCCCSRHDHP